MKIFSLIIIALVIVPSCNKEKNEIKYFWKETFCSNPWMDDYDKTEEEVKAIVIDYLASEKIKVKEVEIEFNANQAQTCEACTCLTGNNIIVITDNKYEKKLTALNFEKHE